MAALSLEDYRAVFAEAAFARFWCGFSLSVVGDAMTRTALTWHVYEATGSAVAVGWLAFCFTAPVLVGGLIAGWLLDRFDRRRLMIADSLIKAAVVALVPLLDALGVLALWHLYLVAGITGFLMMIPLAGTPALLPALVPPARLTTANTLETLSYTLAGVVGPPLAGLLIGPIGAPGVLLADAASYLAFALLLGAAQPRGAASQAAAPGERGLGPALRLLWREPVLWSTSVMFLTFNLGLGALLVWLPIFADRTLGGGPGLYGGLLGALAAGEVASALAVGLLRLPFALGLLICLSQALAGLAVLLLLGGTTALAAMGLAAFGAGAAPLTIWAQSLRMKIIPAAQRGRAFALLRLIMQSGTPLGGLAAGFALPVLGLGPLIALTAALAGLPGLLGLRCRALRQAR